MCVIDEFSDFYRKYVTGDTCLRRLIMECETRLEMIPEGFVEIIAHMFDELAFAARCNRPDPKNVHITKATDSYNQACILCYKVLIADINKRAYKCAKGHTKNELQLMKDFVPCYSTAKRKISTAIQNESIVSYEQAYLSYVQLETLLDKNPQFEITSQNIQIQNMIKFVLKILIPIIISVLLVTIF